MSAACLAAIDPGPRSARMMGGLGPSIAPERLRGRAMPPLPVENKRMSWFTSDSLAAYLQVSDRMIRKWVAEGRLRSYKLDGCRRFEPADVDDFVAQFRQASP